MKTQSYCEEIIIIIIVIIFVY